MLNDLLVHVAYLLGILLVLGFLLLGLIVIGDIILRFYIERIQKK